MDVLELFESFSPNVESEKFTRILSTWLERILSHFLSFLLECSLK